MIPTLNPPHRVEIADHRRAMEATAVRERLASDIRAGCTGRRPTLVEVLRSAAAVARGRRPAVRITPSTACPPPCWTC